MPAPKDMADNLIRPGERVQRTQPAPAAAPEWRPHPTSPGIEVNTRDGRLRTNLPLPK